MHLVRAEARTYHLMHVAGRVAYSGVDPIERMNDPGSRFHWELGIASRKVCSPVPRRTLRRPSLARRIAGRLVGGAFRMR